MASEADSPAGLGKSAELRLSRDSACEDAAYALVEVFRPDGVEAKWLRRVVRLVRNSAATGLPFALNDPKGTWRIRATEVVSGAVAEAALEVR
jgi:hypothetical protein